MRHMLRASNRPSGVKDRILQHRVSHMRTRPLFAILVAAALMSGAAAGCERKSSGTKADPGGADPAASTKPIVVGSTLSLSGAFAATGQIHKIAGEEFVDRLNKAGGLLGRKV